MNKLTLKLRRLSRWDSWRHLPLKLRVRYVAPGRPRNFPCRIQIEATSKCNFRCESCSRGRDKNGGQHLAVEDFCRTLDWLPDRPDRVILSGIGEPLMNPRFFAMVDILAERDIRCEFYSNGSLLAPSVQQEILSRPNIDVICISCDGATAGTFESLRVGADFDLWQQSVGNFLAEAKQRRGHDLSVGANVVLSRRNLGEIRDIIRMVAKMGFNTVSILDPIPVDDVAASMCLSTEEFATLQRGELCRLADSLGLKMMLFLRRRGLMGKLIPRCVQPWEYVFIRANGDVAPCCAVYDSTKVAVVGNVFRQSFDEVWLGEPFRTYRQGSVSNTNPLCSICPYH
jgi:radical SAM protein with 4Fe4S-binding SPASM domain